MLQWHGFLLSRLPHLQPRSYPIHRHHHQIAVASPHASLPLSSLSLPVLILMHLARPTEIDAARLVLLAPASATSRPGVGSHDPRLFPLHCLQRAAEPLRPHWPEKISHWASSLFQVNTQALVRKDWRGAMTRRRYIWSMNCTFPSRS